MCWIRDRRGPSAALRFAQDDGVVDGQRLVGVLGCSASGGAEVDEAGEEEHGEQVEHPVLAAAAAGGDLEDREADEAEARGRWRWSR